MSWKNICWNCGAGKPYVNASCKVYFYVCAVCGKRFSTPHVGSKCCSKICRKQLNRLRSGSHVGKPYYEKSKKLLRYRWKHDSVYRSKILARLEAYRNSPSGRIRISLRKRVKAIIRGPLGNRFHELTGCTPNEVVKHLERLFKPGMTWDNYGTYWHIDHIKPLAKFDLNDPNQRKLACHWSNLQPLEAKENLSKGAR